MKRQHLVALAFLVAGSAAPAAAQTLRGDGPTSTQPVPLVAGSLAVDIEHQGGGTFTVRLLNRQGVQVTDVVRALGAVRESRTIQVPVDGTYVFDVEATGAWAIRLRGSTDVAPRAEATLLVAVDSTPTALGQVEGDVAARGTGWSWGWFGKGFLGGVVGGPIGTIIVAKRAGRSDIGAPVVQFSSTDPAYRFAFQEAFELRLRARRKEAALVGGLAGTATLITVLTQFLDLEGAFGGGGTPPDPPIGVSISAPLGRRP